MPMMAIPANVGDHACDDGAGKPGEMTCFRIEDVQHHRAQDGSHSGTGAK